MAPILEFGIGELRDLEVSGVDQAQLVASEDSMRVESLRFLVNNGTGIDLDNGPHVVVDSEFAVTTTVNAFAIRTTGDVTVRGSELRSLAGSSVELIGMDGGDLTVEYSTIEGVALGIFSCCSDGTGTLKVRHTLIDVTKRPIAANLRALELEIEASTLIGVTSSNIVGLNAGGRVVMRQSTVVGGGVGGTGHSETCRGTTTATGFLSSSCPRPTDSGWTTRRDHSMISRSPIIEIIELFELSLQRRRVDGSPFDSRRLTGDDPRQRPGVARLRCHEYHGCRDTRWSESQRERAGALSGGVECPQATVTRHR